MIARAACVLLAGLVASAAMAQEAPPAPETAPAPQPESGEPQAPADEAFGAFQRGYFLTALELALPRAEKGDAAAQTRIAELYGGGLGGAQRERKSVV